VKIATGHVAAVDLEREFDGLDFTTHGERAYDYAG
jgi:hypothetical protein